MSGPRQRAILSRPADQADRAVFTGRAAGRRRAPHRRLDVLAFGPAGRGGEPPRRRRHDRRQGGHGRRSGRLYVDAGDVGVARDLLAALQDRRLRSAHQLCGDFADLVDTAGAGGVPRSCPCIRLRISWPTPRPIPASSTMAHRPERPLTSTARCSRSSPEPTSFSFPIARPPRRRPTCSRVSSSSRSREPPASCRS